MRNAWRALCTVVVLSAVPAAPAAPVPQDLPYAGTLQLAVDLTDIPRRLLRVQQTLPVRPGPLTLLYPQWLPGNHAPRGVIEQMAGLVIRGGGAVIPWQRDPLDVFAFQLEVPAGVDELDIQFQVATPNAADQGRIVVTPTLANLQWQQVLLYPAGHYNSRIAVQARLRLPAGWQQASAMAATVEGDTVRYEATTLEVLVDSPVFAGPHVQRYDLAPGQSVPVRLNVFAGDPADLAATPEQLARHRALVRELYAALGPPVFDRYEFLLGLTDQLGGIGLEHHRSSENTHAPGYFRQWDQGLGRRELLGHEMVHAWNGKRRRPAALWTPQYNVPMQNSLLWVYEGMTQYYGELATVRAGLLAPEVQRDALAETVATFERRRPGRAWRSLGDTTYQPITAARRPLAWSSWQRSEDYYAEGSLLWLEVDLKLRELTRGKASLDDFARRFFAAPADRGLVSTYGFDDVVAGLQALAPGVDWAGFLRERVDGVAQPLGALERAGLRLVYNDTPNAQIRDAERDGKRTDLGFGLGLGVNNATGTLTEVVWDSPAFQAGLVPGAVLVAVNGRAFSGEGLKDAVVKAADGRGIELIVREGDAFRTLRIDYRGGLAYPHLEVLPGRRDGLVELFKPRTAVQ